LRSIPIIAVTSYALSGEDKKARAAGCDDCVQKPFSPRQLLPKIRQYIPSLGLLHCSMSAFGTKRTSRPAQPMSAFGGKADISSAVDEPYLGNFPQHLRGRSALREVGSHYRPRRFGGNLSSSVGSTSGAFAGRLADHGGGRKGRNRLIRKRTIHNSQIDFENR
jgi:hypothetical protein